MIGKGQHALPVCDHPMSAPTMNLGLQHDCSSFIAQGLVSEEDVLCRSTAFSVIFFLDKYIVPSSTSCHVASSLSDASELLLPFDLPGFRVTALLDCCEGRR